MNFFKKLIAMLVLLNVCMISVHASEHDLFDAVLKENVSPEGQVNYPGIKDDSRFLEYIDYLAGANPDAYATKQEKLAFWINAYNALTMKGILDGLSPGSFFSRITFFKTTDYKVAGREINLYDLERDIIIPFNEPRIHFAINCASASCPILIPEAYTAKKLEQQLEANTIAFINDQSKNMFDLNKKTALISKIFDWFPEDFERSANSVQKYLANYVEDAEVSKLLAQDGFRIKYLKYDWSLNGIAVK